MEDLPGAASVNHSCKRKAGGMDDQTALPVTSVDVSVPWESDKALACSQEDCLPCKRPKVALAAATSPSSVRRASLPVRLDVRCVPLQSDTSVRCKPARDTSIPSSDLRGHCQLDEQSFTFQSKSAAETSKTTPKPSDFVLQKHGVVKIPSSMAPALPPINSESLAVLDIENILSNLQLREYKLFFLRKTKRPTIHHRP